MIQFNEHYALPLLKNFYQTNENLAERPLLLPLHKPNEYKPLLSEITDFYSKILVYGSAASGKSIAIIHFLCLVCRTEKSEVLALRKFGSTVSNSIMRDIAKVLDAWREPYKLNKNERKFTLLRTGSVVVCSGLDNAQKLLSTKWRFIWFEEADQFTSEDFVTVQTRQRGTDSNRKLMIFSTNPPSTSHVIYKRFYLNENQDNALVLWANYQVNEHNLTQQDISNLLQMKLLGEEYAKRYLYGEFIEYNESNVFKHIKTISDADYDKIEPTWVGYGIDFGWIDPNVLLEVKFTLQKEKVCVFVKELIYKSGIDNFPDLCYNEISKRYFNAPVFPDSANPEKISKLISYKLSLRNVDKSVYEGIQAMHACDIYITASSVNLRKEINNYRYPEKVDKSSGRKVIFETDKPIGEDHCLDALRYVIYNHENVRSYYYRYAKNKR